MIENVSKHEHLEIKQKYLGDKGLILFITLMNMFIPLSTDLYLPALPTMSAYFNCNSSTANLSLSAFFLFFAVGILIWGPLSDKYGRKPILIVGTIMYMVSSILCAVSTNIYFLIIVRALQGIGAGSITSVSAAIIKDCFSGKKRETMLAITQTMSGLAPMLAPIVGALILKFASWRGTFWTLTLISIVSLTLTLMYQETLREEERYNGTLLGTIKPLFQVAKNKSLMLPTVIFALTSIPFMGYLALSSYIYVNYFKLSEQTYSYFFAANALVSLLGPMLYVRFLSKTNKKAFSIGCFTVCVISGVLVMTIGKMTPVLFLLSFVILSLTSAAMRPFSTNLLFDQQEGNAGSTSSLINTINTVLGTIGMSIASISLGNIVVGLGMLITVFSAISLVSWYIFLKSRIPCVGIKDINSESNIEMCS